MNVFIEAFTEECEKTARGVMSGAKSLQLQRASNLQTRGRSPMLNMTNKDLVRYAKSVMLGKSTRRHRSGKRKMV